MDGVENNALCYMNLCYVSVLHDFVLRLLGAAHAANADFLLSSTSSALSSHTLPSPAPSSTRITEGYEWPADGHGHGASEFCSWGGVVNSARRSLFPRSDPAG